MLAASRLHTLGVSEKQLKGLFTNKQAADSIQILSPVDGVILSRNIIRGQQVEKGGEFYRIADLCRVWVVASFHEGEVRGLHPGTQVKITVPTQERSWRARVSGLVSTRAGCGVMRFRPAAARRPRMTPRGERGRSPSSVQRCVSRS